MVTSNQTEPARSAFCINYLLQVQTSIKVVSELGIRLYLAVWPKNFVPVQPDSVDPDPVHPSGLSGRVANPVFVR